MVKCAECGYLAVRNVDSYHLDETGTDFREKGMVALGRQVGRNQYQLHELQPLCFVQRYNLRSEIKSEFASGKNEVGCILQVISKERECGKFTAWQQGFTPKEHYEMLDRQRWQDWQEKQRRSDKRWRIIELIVLGFIVTIIAGGFTVLGAFIGRGSLFPPSP